MMGGGRVERDPTALPELSPRAELVGQVPMGQRGEPLGDRGWGSPGEPEGHRDRTAHGTGSHPLSHPRREGTGEPMDMGTGELGAR